MKARVFKQILTVIIFLFLCNFNSAYSQQTDMKDIKEEIQIINLLNNLDLNKEQMQDIIDCSEKAVNLRKAYDERMGVIKPQMTVVLASIKDQVNAGKIILDKDTSKKYHELKAKHEEIEKNCNINLDILAGNIEKNLKEYQLCAIDGYKPCIIPIVSKGRIGQSDSSVQIIKLLNKIKNMPEERYQLSKELIAEKTIEKIKEKLHKNYKYNEADIKNKMTAFFDNIRKTDPANFKMEEDKFAKKFEDEFYPVVKGLERKEKIKKFLLSEKIIGILQSRINK